MEISVKNLGALAWAKFELGNLTIICGNNNTGKTYATYALFGFLAFWREIFRIPVSQASMDQLLRDGVTRIDIRTVVDDADRIIKQGCEAFKEQLPKVFASAEKHFEATEFLVTLDKTDIHPTAAFERTIGAAKTQLFTVSKKENDPTVLFLLSLRRKS
jgi:predicted ATPase